MAAHPHATAPFEPQPLELAPARGQALVLGRLFAAASFAGATLVFLVQPMAARMVLPLFGGSQSVWTTSMVFFQAVRSTASPLLQHSFSHAGHRAASDPYFLCAAGNAGSLPALLIYPIVVDPPERLAPLLRAGWEPLRAEPGTRTDDFSNILSVIDWSG